MEDKNLRRAFSGSIRKFQEGSVMPSLNTVYSKDRLEDASIFLRKIEEYTSPEPTDTIPPPRPKPTLVTRDAQAKTVVADRPQAPTTPANYIEIIPDDVVTERSIPYTPIIGKNVPFLDEPSWKKYAAFINKKEMGGKKDSKSLKRFNRYGYVGAFQLGDTALQSAGFLKSGKLSGSSRKAKILNASNWVGGKKAMNSFLSSYDVQEKALKAFSANNFGLIKKTLEHYNITDREQILAYLSAAHLGGHTSVKNYLKSGGTKVFKDGNGTKITTYINNYLKFKI